MALSNASWKSDHFSLDRASESWLHFFSTWDLRPKGIHEQSYLQFGFTFGQKGQEIITSPFNIQEILIIENNIREVTLNNAQRSPMKKLVQAQK